jgi:hypothetical protein
LDTTLGKKVFSVALLLVLVAVSLFSLMPLAKAQAYSYTFNGPYDEKTAAYLSTNATVIVHFNDGVTSSDVFNVGVDTGYTYVYTPASQPQYFEYNVYNLTGIGDNIYREYWLNTNEPSGTYNIYVPSSLATYTINFADYVGTLKTYPFVLAQINIDGTYYTVDKMPVDSQNSVVMDLLVGNRYRILLSDGVAQIVYGDIFTTSTLGIQLVLRGVDFPQQTLLLYQYVHAYAIRDFLNPTGSITVSYGDTTNKTNNVTITITDSATSAVAFASVFSGVGNQTFSYSWIYADNATSYEVTVAINHQTFGVFNYKQYLLGEYAKPSEPFSLDFLGSGFPISTAVLIPALLIIFVAGCFSELTSEVATILTTIVAIILSAMGWIPITQGAIITALALSVMAGIVAARRRMSFG